jgi:IS605 OrfB family transposase
MTLTYCQGLSNPVEELNALGFTTFSMFLLDFAKVFHQAACETANHLLTPLEFNKSKWNSYLQQKYKINKRHANGIIVFSQAAVDSAVECKQSHIKTLQGKIKSILKWINQGEKLIKSGQNFYSKKKWQNSKSSCLFPLSCNLKTQRTNWQNLKFNLHNKKRKLFLLENKLKHLELAPVQVTIPKNQLYIVGSKDETLGNQVCQYDGEQIKFRVPECLENKFGKYVYTQIGSFQRGVNRLPQTGAKTWHFYLKNNKWNGAVQFTPTPVTQVSRPVIYGCIGIDLNPGSIGWAYVDCHGNLKRQGKIPLEMGLPKGQQQAQIVKASLELVKLASIYACPIVCEELDFSHKKESLKEKGKKYARMLSGWAYSKFQTLLQSICANRGIELIKVNPAFTSLIGLAKYSRQYGIGSDVSAAIAIARRAMRLTEQIPSALTAYLGVNSKKHVWHSWGKLNTIYKKLRINRHLVYSISNWESLVKQASLVSVST